MKLGLVNPLPIDKIKNFAASVDRVVVIEELDPVIETHCKSMGIEVDGKNMFSICGEFSQKMIADAFGIKTNSFTENSTITKSGSKDSRSLSALPAPKCEVVPPIPAFT